MLHHRIDQTIDGGQSLGALTIGNGSHGKPSDPATPDRIQDPRLSHNEIGFLETTARITDPGEKKKGRAPTRIS